MIDEVDQGQPLLDEAVRRINWQIVSNRIAFAARAAPFRALKDGAYAKAGELAH
ncbi:hypothetical protein [Mesorhizobium sp.]|uniref:hypothetical protein n=1 Tax=Mesorhizobium sp. TaxID=1871066 RepID=UPI0025BB5B74|nr:hypothetical protein [Mesorhizobium sp.]